jgi:hypothetical protein
MIDEGDTQADAGGVLQRAIILQTLRPDHTDEWAPSELEQVLETPSETLVEALIDLEASNVIECTDGFVSASRCVKLLDALGLLAC